MLLSDFDFELPPELIAQHPAAERRASRLLHLHGATGALTDRAFVDILALVRPGDVMVFNDTRVIKARLTGVKDSGGKVEMLVERVLTGGEALAQIRASHSPKAGGILTLAGGVMATVTAREGHFFRLRFEGCDNVYALLEQHGETPLPPYITHPPGSGDDTRYQTVYARTPGAVAAPTAGLHFDEDLLEELLMRGVQLAWLTLHVGAGTFQPVRENDLSRHEMHSECYDIPQATVEAVRAARCAGRRVIAVGTTSLRALESAAVNDELQPGARDTRLFITPGYVFRAVDALVTNFHLPKSTLLMLVSAFAGVDNIRRAYAYAIANRYRFFSYGDAMFLERAQ
jgi:S-adenosylmethionine:tRNA ribosyltransferase-isomerase